jgi:predicted phosphodiesterase
MPRETTVIGKLVQETILKFPASSKSAIAELLHVNHPHLFNSKEHARTLVRSYTNSLGNAKVKDAVEHNSEFSAQNPFGLNYSRCKEREFVTLPISSNNILWLSDIHFPNHDIQALTAALNYGKQQNINCIVLGGDILDNEPFTSHDAPPPSKDDVLDWFDMVEEFLDMLNKEFPNAEKVWLEGNHDNWYMRYLMKKAPVLFGDSYYHLPKRLNLKDKNVEFLSQNKILKAGKLMMLHGHTVMRGMFSPVNPARGVFMKLKTSAIIGHVHQTSSHSESNLKSEIIACWSVGCLCTLAADYDPHNTKHNLGFAHILVDEKGDYEVHNKRIINGKIF